MNRSFSASHPRKQTHRPPPTPSPSHLPSLRSNNRISESERDDDSDDSDSDNLFSDDNDDGGDHLSVTPQFLRGVPQTVLKQLLIDIETHGGLVGLKLTSLCNKKPDIYGRPGSALRRKVQNKTCRLKHLSPTAYLHVLNYFNVPSGLHTSSLTPTVERHSTTTPRRESSRPRPAFTSPSPPRSAHFTRTPPPRTFQSPLPIRDSAARRLNMNSQKYADFDVNEIVGKL